MRREYSGLDILRFLAALAVAAFHVGYWAWRDGSVEPMPALVPWVSFGWVGVEVFFVISGFVIAYSATAKTAAQFVWRRALRLYPAVWVCAIITAVLVPVTIKTFIRSIILFPIGPWVSVVYWTLPLEMAFYAFVAIALWRHVKLQHLALGLGYFSTSYWVLMLASRAVPALRPTLFNGEIGFLFLPQFGVFFALGMLLFARRHVPSMVIFATVALGEIVYRTGDLQSSVRWTAPLAFLIALAFIVVSILRKDAVDRAISRLPSRAMGLASYPLYLLHAEIGERIVRLSANPYVGFLIALVVVCLLAFLVLPAEGLIRGSLNRLAGGTPLTNRGPADLP